MISNPIECNSDSIVSEYHESVESDVDDDAIAQNGSETTSISIMTNATAGISTTETSTTKTATMSNRSRVINQSRYLFNNRRIRKFNSSAIRVPHINPKKVEIFEFTRREMEAF